MNHNEQPSFQLPWHTAILIAQCLNYGLIEDGDIFQFYLLPRKSLHVYLGENHPVDLKFFTETKIIIEIDMK